MEVQVSHSDIISNLPQDLIQEILTLLPTHEALRTSILSRKWRYKWTNIPKLVFDNKLPEGLTNDSSDSDKLSNSRKFFNAIYQVVLLHHGPLLEFKVSIPDLQSCPEVDQIILHLTMGNTVDTFRLTMGDVNSYKLPTSFFSLHHLTNLHLENCTFQLPTTFCGFKKLLYLYFFNVSITAETVQLVICNCPRLLQFTLVGNEGHISGGENSCLVELFGHLPLIRYLCINHYPIKCFAIGGIPRKLPTPLFHLFYLNLHHVCLMEPDDLSFALLLIRSSPYLQTIEIRVSKDEGTDIGAVRRELQDHADFSLDHLEVVKVRNFNNVILESGFVQLIMAKAFWLKKVLLTLAKDVDASEELKILKALLELGNASRRAQIFCNSFGK